MEVLTVKLAICRLGKNKFHVNYYFSGCTARRQASLANQYYAEGVAKVKIFWYYGTLKGLFQKYMFKKPNNQQGEIWALPPALLYVLPAKSALYANLVDVLLKVAPKSN